MSESVTIRAGSQKVVDEERTRTPVGSDVGRYFVLGELGRGGMGRVLWAYDPKLEREVALKQVRRAVLDAEMTARMVAEARAMAKLSHPNVVAVYDVEEVSGAPGRTDSAEVVLVMEYVHGQSLRAWLDDEPRPWHEVVAAFVEAGRGLAAAHAVGLLHRDFKPDNVLVREATRDGGRQIKVTDFGLAKVFAPTEVSSASTDRAAPDDTSESTATGVVMGTPRYMAPEQHDPARSGAAPLTAAADQYAFCVSLWQALCGEFPFPASRLHEAKRAGPPRWRNAAVPRRVAEAIRRGLLPDPRERWPSMNALLRALAFDSRRRRNLWLGALGTAAAATVAQLVWESRLEAEASACSGGAEKLGETWNDERRAEVEVAVMGVEAPYAAEVWERSAAALDDHAAKWLIMYKEACEATTVRGEASEEVLDLRMACLHRTRVELGAVVGVLSTADAAVVQRAHAVVGQLRPLQQCADVDGLKADVAPPTAAEADAVDAARAHLADANAEFEAGRYPTARTRIEEAREILSTTHYWPADAELAIIDGRVHEAEANYDAADEALSGAVASAARWRQAEPMARASLHLFHLVGERHGQFGRAMAHARVARGLAREPLEQAAVHNSLAAVFAARGEYATAEAHARRAVAIWAEEKGADHPATGVPRANLAGTLARRGKLEEAEAELRRALEIKVKALGPEHPDIAGMHSNLGGMLHALGKNDEAERAIRRALEGEMRALGPDHPRIAGVRSNLGLVLAAQGRLDEAEAEQRRALAINDNAWGPEHAQTGSSYTNLGIVLVARGRLEEAEQAYRRGLAIGEATLPPDDPGLAASRLNLAVLLVDDGRAEAALEFAEPSWARLQRDDMPAEKRADAAFILGFALSQLGRTPDRVRSLFVRARKNYRAAERSEKVELVEGLLRRRLRAADRSRARRWHRRGR